MPQADSTPLWEELGLCKLRRRANAAALTTLPQLGSRISSREQDCQQQVGHRCPFGDAVCSSGEAALGRIISLAPRVLLSKHPISVRILGEDLRTQKCTRAQSLREQRVD